MYKIITVPLLVFITSLSLYSKDDHQGDGFEFKAICPLLVYELGNSSKYEIKVYQPDSLYHIVIFKDDLLLLDEIPEDPAILDWAVWSLPAEISEVEFAESEEYSPVFYRITVFAGENRRILIDSSKKVNKNRNFKIRVSKLQQFLMEYWLRTISD